MERRAFLTTAISTCCGLAATSRAVAQVDVADKELDILLDGSDSMLQPHESGTHWSLQVRGHEAALQDREVQRQLVDQQVYVRVVVYRGELRDHVEVFAGLIVSRRDLSELAGTLHAIEQPTSGLGTYQNHALEHMARLTPIGYRRIIDICSDDIVSGSILGETLFWRQQLQDAGTDVNVLAVDTASDGSVIRNLAKCLQTTLPTSFTEPVGGWSFEPFVAATKRKLRRELAS